LAQRKIWRDGADGGEAAVLIQRDLWPPPPANFNDRARFFAREPYNAGLLSHDGLKAGEGEISTGQ
jgi:hypothetical protein